MPPYMKLYLSYLPHYLKPILFPKFMASIAYFPVDLLIWNIVFHDEFSHFLHLFCIILTESVVTACDGVGTDHYFNSN